jgi:hypothetical protein
LSLSANTDMNARIILTRESGYWADRLRAYRVVIDKKKVTSIHEGERHELEVAPGFHSLHLGIDFCRSKILDLDLYPGQQIAIWCRPNARLYSWPFFLTVGCVRYVAVSDRSWK